MLFTHWRNEEEEVVSLASDMYERKKYDIIDNKKKYIFSDEIEEDLLSSTAQVNDESMEIEEDDTPLGPNQVFSGAHTDGDIFTDMGLQATTKQQKVCANSLSNYV